MEMGNFSRAVVTLFRIAGGETWIGEPPDEGMPIINEQGFVNWGTAAFVMSFVVIVNWTLLQVRCGPARPLCPTPAMLSCSCQVPLPGCSHVAHTLASMAR